MKRRKRCEVRTQIERAMPTAQSLRRYNNADDYLLDAVQAAHCSRQGFGSARSSFTCRSLRQRLRPNSAESAADATRDRHAARSV